jgi:hypothetical protein
VGFPLSALLRTEMIYLGRFPRGPQIVLNGVALGAKAAPPAVGSKPSLDNRRTTAPRPGLYRRGAWKQLLCRLVADYRSREAVLGVMKVSV